MINKQFEAYKLKRELKKSGIFCTFLEMKTNEFGEPTDEYEEKLTVKCLYHEQNSNIQISMGETTEVRTKKIPMLLCIYDDVAGIVKPEDRLQYNGKTFVVQGIVNIQEWGIIADISLEVVDDGRSNKD